MVARAAKRSVKTRRKARVKVQVPRHQPDRVLQPGELWARQEAKLKAWRERVDTTPTMQGDAWKAGQLRHIDHLIAQHQANKPQ